MSQQEKDCLLSIKKVHSEQSIIIARELLPEALEILKGGSGSGNFGHGGRPGEVGGSSGEGGGGSAGEGGGRWASGAASSVGGGKETISLTSLRSLNSRELLVHQYIADQTSQRLFTSGDHAGGSHYSSVKGRIFNARANKEKARFPMTNSEVKFANKEISRLVAQRKANK